MKKLTKFIFLAFFIFGIIPFLYFLFLLSPTGLSSKEVRFVVPLEAKQEKIATRLKKDNFIRSEKLFTLIAGLIRFPGVIEPGAYLLSHRMTMLKLADTLMNHPYQKWVVLVPGLRVEQVAEKLEKKFRWNKEKMKEFLAASKEGYMFPDTYLLNVDYTGREFAQRLISNFNEKFDASLQRDLLSQNVRNDTAIKIASLIERETGGEEDKTLIAGIIWNRLKKHMKLEIDATVQYVLGTAKDWWPNIRGKNLKSIDSPYNTYLYKGLPPTPIANPSLSSIKAAVYPKQTDCLYYIHAHDKRIYCAKTYKEHLENIDKYLRLR